MSGPDAGLKELMQVQENEGPDKVCSLQDAIRKLVKPEMSLFVSVKGQGAIMELLREFRRKQPKFTLSIIDANDFHMLPLHEGLVKRLVTSIVLGNSASGRSPILQQALRRGTPEVEWWTIYTMCLRLMATSLGFPFLPTNSIMGTTMAPDLGPRFKEVEDPFGTGQRVGLVPALAPDISFLHAIVADRAGNAILAPEWQVERWAARASKGGAIVMAEKVVSTAFIREHAHMVSVPSFLVQAVCPMPYACLPGGMFNCWVPGVASYGADREMNLSYGKASVAGEEALNAWLKEWVLDTGSHEGLLSKLGKPRLERLNALTMGETGGEHTGAPARKSGYTDREMIVVAAGRKIEEVVRKRGHRMVMVGVGIAAPATFLAYYNLKESGQHVELAIGFGNVGFAPRTYSLGDPQHFFTAKMFGDMVDVYGSFLAGPKSKTLCILGIGEIDRHGNINTSRLADGSFLVGSGGHQDGAIGAGEVLLTATLAPHRFREKLGYITTGGGNVRTVVTDLGVLEKPEGGDELMLSSYYGSDKVKEADAVAKIKAQCGWDLKVSPGLKREPVPSERELAMIRRLDPRGEVTG